MKSIVRRRARLAQNLDACAASPTSQQAARARLVLIAFAHALFPTRVAVWCFVSVWESRVLVQRALRFCVARVTGRRDKSFSTMVSALVTVWVCLTSKVWKVFLLVFLPSSRQVWRAVSAYACVTWCDLRDTSEQARQWQTRPIAGARVSWSYSGNVLRHEPCVGCMIADSTVRFFVFKLHI